ncbi:hypothetical protein BOSE62_150058 [Bosea sp. 62]|nr:hypothetical protein BOSE46_20240 [Bosea sp. 46]VVT43480.1 hypothetical protein BOS5A_10060 [Bosea sp. EC-HK365B]VXB66403.1 hypothetical protein BOSE62_150058 [Bosea sp. 62]
MRSERSARTNSAKGPSGVRYWMRLTISPSASIGASTPRSSRISSVAGWKVEALEAAVRAARFSSTTMSTPALARIRAATRPTGPAPATITCVVRLVVMDILRSGAERRASICIKYAT